MFRLIKPILKELRKPQLLIPAPYVEVTKRAEDEFMANIRAEMKKKVWEKDGGVVSFLFQLLRFASLFTHLQPRSFSQSWYVDPKTGLCHVRISRSQFLVHTS
jgi:hypothetical protein